MMTRLFRSLVLALSLTFGTAVAADDGAAPAIADTIQGQIDAFLKDDFAQAFTFASPNIRGIFQTPSNFGRMVTQGFPMVHRPDDVRFLDLREIAGVLYQRVQIQDKSGRVHLLDYQMIELEDGWKINGVQLLESAGVSA